MSRIPLPTPINMQDVLGKSLNELSSIIQSKYLPGQLQARNSLLNAQLQNALINNQYLPDQLKNKNALLQAQIPLAQENLSHQKLVNQYYPLLSLLTAQNALNRTNQLNNSMSRFGGSYELVKMVQAMSPSYRATWLASPENSKAYDNAVVIASQNLVHPNKINNNFNLSGTIQDQLSKLNLLNPSDIKPINNMMNYSNSSNNINNNSAQNINDSSYNKFPFVNPDEQQTEREIDAAKSEALHKTQTTAQQNQRLYEKTANNIREDGDKLINSVKKFAGIKGSAKKISDQIGAAITGQSNEDYENYLIFKNRIIPQYANELRKMQAGSATKEEMRAFNKIVFPLNQLWSLTPQQTVDIWNNLRSFQQKQANTLRKSTNQINQPNTKNSVNVNNFPFKTVSLSQVEDYAKRSNMSIESVIAALKEKGVR